MRLDANNLPVYSHLNNDGVAIMRRCITQNCSDYTTAQLLSTPFAVVEPTLLYIKPDNKVSFIAENATQVGFYKCDTISCLQSIQTNVTGGQNLGSSTNYYKSLYAGDIFAKNVVTSNFDLAENYVASDTSLEAGDITGLDAEGLLVKAGSQSAVTTLGIISTKPGLLLGNWDDSSGKIVRPVALSGRVPLKLSIPLDELNSLPVGTKLTINKQVPGTAKIAAKDDVVIGVTLAKPVGNLVEVFVQSSGIGNQLSSKNTACSSFQLGGETCSFDLRYNKNILRLGSIPTSTSATSIINGLKPVSYQWNGDNKDLYGFMAQDVEAIMPGLVSVNSEGIKTVNTLGITSYLVKALQETNSKIDGLGAVEVDGLRINVEQIKTSWAAELPEIKTRLVALEASDKAQNADIETLKQQNLKLEAELAEIRKLLQNR
jgi:hypothetical protein